MDGQEMPVVAALIEADSLLRIAHQLILCLIQLQVVHIEPLIRGSSIENELVGGDGKERASQLSNAWLIKVLQVLTGQDHAGLLLPYSLEAVTDVGHCHRIAEPQVQLIDSGHGIPGGKKPVGHIGEDTEQQGVPQILSCIF